MRFRLLVMLGLVALAPPVGVRAQTLSFLRPFADEAGAPAGPVVNSISAYTGVYALGRPTNLVGDITSSTSPGTILVGGMATDVGWYVTGRRSQAFVDYSLAYNGDVQFSQLRGFDHVLVFGAQESLSPRLTLVLDGLGESISYGGILFVPSSSLLLAQQGATAEQLGGAPATKLAGTGAVTSALGLSLYGARRRDAAMGTRLVFTKSPRTTWTMSTRFERFLPAAPGSGGVSASIDYAGMTQGIATLGFTYSASRRTALDGEFSYSRSYWMGRGVQVGSALIGVGRDLSPHWFARIGAGYGGMTEFPGSLKMPYEGSVQGGAGLGAKIANSTLTFSASRSISDAYGLGASNTTSAQVGWAWQRAGGAWTLAGSAGYERLTGTVFALIQSWIGQITVTRRLSKQLTLVAQGTYASDAGVAGGDFASLLRQGARLSLTWRPRGAQAK